jgi:DNA-binding CsgD family transcriptional regulator
MLNAGDPPTERELQVLHTVIMAGSVPAASRLLHLSPDTVNAHLDHLRNKSGCHTVAQLLAWVVRNGWWDGDPLITK